MNILVFHPELGMGVTDESYQFTPASKADPETYKQLLSKGEVLSDVFPWQGYVFYGAPKVPFWVVTDLDLPLDLPFDFNKVGDKIYKCHTWVPAVILYLQKSYSSWKITLEEPIVRVEIPMPEICEGETWATTEDKILPSQVGDDSYCIENNWEQRGVYWIIDSLPRNKRIIHSDTMKFNEEYDIG